MLVALPMISLLVAIASLGGLARRDEWGLLFGTVGAVTMAAGIAAWFLVRDVPSIRPQQDGVLASIVHGLKPSTVAANPKLYWALLALTVLSTATQIYMPFLLIYIERYLKIESYALLLAITLVAASTISVIGGRIIDRVGKLRFVLPAAAVHAAGLVLMFAARDVVPVVLAGIIVVSGFMLLGAAVAGLVRDHSPRDRVGSVQGVRVLLISTFPSMIGPFIGAAVIIDANEHYLDLGVLKQVPTPGIFLAAAITLTLIVLPALALKRLDRAAGLPEKEAQTTPS